MSDPVGAFPEGTFPEGDETQTTVNTNGIDSVTLLDIANNPQSISVDGRTVSEHSLQDLIALDKHLATKAQQAKGNTGWASIGWARAALPGGSGEC